ncbi:type II secretion system protein [Gracilaria domingensis]|nr:type II secretion system protein [Gracilaria domingensis]
MHGCACAHGAHSQQPLPVRTIGATAAAPKSGAQAADGAPRAARPPRRARFARRAGSCRAAAAAAICARARARAYRRAEGVCGARAAADTHRLSDGVRCPPALPPAVARRVADARAAVA